MELPGDLGRRGARSEDGAAVCVPRRSRSLRARRLRRRVSLRPDRPAPGDPDRPTGSWSGIRCCSWRSGREVGGPGGAGARGRLRLARRIGLTGDGRRPRRARAAVRRPTHPCAWPRTWAWSSARRSAGFCSCSARGPRSSRAVAVLSAIGMVVAFRYCRNAARLPRRARRSADRCRHPRRPALPIFLGSAVFAWLDVRRVRGRVACLARRRLRVPAVRVGLPRLGQPAARHALPGATDARRGADSTCARSSCCAARDGAPVPAARLGRRRSGRSSSCSSYSSSGRCCGVPTSQAVVAALAPPRYSGRLHGRLRERPAIGFALAPLIGLQVRNSFGDEATWAMFAAIGVVAAVLGASRWPGFGAGPRRRRQRPGGVRLRVHTMAVAILLSASTGDRGASRLLYWRREARRA